jgi:dienelactone hydrolase
MEIGCGHCGRRFRGDAKLAGKRVKCKCGQVIHVPAEEVFDESGLELVGDEPSLAAEPAPVPPPIKPIAPIAPIPKPAASRRMMPMAPAAPAAPVATHTAYAPIAPPPMAAPPRAIPQYAQAYAQTRKKPITAKAGAWGGGLVTLLIVIGIVLKILRAIGAFSGGGSGDISVPSPQDGGGIAAISTGSLSASRPSMSPISGGTAGSTTVTHDGHRTRVKLYLPSGTHANRSLGVVFIAPAGSTGLWGMSLSEGDTPEHLPYVQAGLAVVAYELSGPVNTETPTDKQVMDALEAFADSEAGLKDARAAMAFVKQCVPEVNPEWVFWAGHSSAGLHALQVACSQSGVRACVAFAPVSDLAAFQAEALAQIESEVEGVQELAERYSPSRMGTPRCPVTIFHASDDDIVPISQSQTFARQHAGKVKLVTVSSGGHYESMTSRGIPLAIQTFTGIISADKQAGGRAAAAGR